MKNYKIFVAFEYHDDEPELIDRVYFAFADDDLKLHFGGSPKKSYLLTPAQAANVFFANLSREPRNCNPFCIDITKKELKTLRKEFKKQGFMPFNFFEKLMLEDKYFADATVFLKQEPQAEATEKQQPKIVAKRKGFIVYTRNTDGSIGYLCLNSVSVIIRDTERTEEVGVYRTWEEADFIACVLNSKGETNCDWKVKAIEF